MINRISILLIISLLFSGQLVLAQSKKNDSTLTIGLKEAPPFVIKRGDDFSGISIESWKKINKDLQYEYNFVEYQTIEELLNAVEKGEVDLSINPITVTEKRMSGVKFSQPYFISKTVIAKKSGSRLFGLIKNIFSWKFFSALFALLSVIAFFGFLIWIFERKSNKEEFGGTLKGIGQGFWWSAVTMTTVGYGDKSPRTLGGRIIGFIWMFMAIILISGLTAGIASALTVQGINESINSIRDLNKFRVTTVENSSASELLDLYGIQHSEKIDLNEGIDELEEDRAEVLVYDKPILRYQLKERNLDDEISIIDRDFKVDYYSYSFPKNSGLVKQIDPKIIALLKTADWNMTIEDYE